VVVAIAGAHGQVARRLTRLLVERGDRVIGLIRNPDHAGDVRLDGGDPVVCDLESVGTAALAEIIGDADAAVFAAGAGPGSGSERKWTMDRDGAIKLLDAAVDAGVTRYVIVSSVGAESPPAGDDTFSVYLRAKAEADAAVVESDRDWTIIRPGMLTNEPGTGRVLLQAAPVRAEVSRDDVAGVLAAVLHEPRSARLTLYAVGGETPIAEAVEAVLP
jgi:uncharacterized protein YbjT (DUF2867 family)